ARLAEMGSGERSEDIEGQLARLRGIMDRPDALDDAIQQTAKAEAEHRDLHEERVVVEIRDEGDTGAGRQEHGDRDLNDRGVKFNIKTWSDALHRHVDVPAFVLWPMACLAYEVDSTIPKDARTPE